jgi:hypothetical protein
MNVALGIRKLFSNFLLGVNNFVRNVRDRIQGLLFNIRMSFLKLNNLMGRVYGTMYAVIWMGTSALTAGMNVSENDLVKFLLEFCFDPSTPVKMADGSTKPIRDIKIGDILASTASNNAPIVTSVFRFAGENTPMVKIHDIVLSAQHYVFHKTWMEAQHHPDAIPVSSIPELVCLNVSGHQFKVGDILVADYDEHESADVVHATQRIAIQRLNGANAVTKTVDDYSLGIDGAAEIRMKNGSWKPLHTLTLGEEVMNCGKILGIVQEDCDTTVKLDGVCIAAAQLVFEGQIWRRAAHLKDVAKSEPKILFQLITETCGTMTMRFGNKEQFLRDYREIADPDMESAYAEKFMESL